MPGKEKTDHHGNRERGGRLDEPRTQLDQVVHQGRLGRLDFLLFVFAAHPLRSVLSGSAATATGSGSAATGATVPASGKAGAALASGFGSTAFGSAVLSSGFSKSLPIDSTSARTSL